MVSELNVRKTITIDKELLGACEVFIKTMKQNNAKSIRSLSDLVQIALVYYFNTLSDRLNEKEEK